MTGNRGPVSSDIGADRPHSSSVDPFDDCEKHFPDNSADEDGESKLHECVMQFSELKDHTEV